MATGGERKSSLRSWRRSDEQGRHPGGGLQCAGGRAEPDSGLQRPGYMASGGRRAATGAGGVWRRVATSAGGGGAEPGMRNPIVSYSSRAKTGKLQHVQVCAAQFSEKRTAKAADGSTAF